MSTFVRTASPVLTTIPEAIARYCIFSAGLKLLAVIMLSRILLKSLSLSAQRGSLTDTLRSLT